MHTDKRKQVDKDCALKLKGYKRVNAFGNVIC